MVPWFSARAPAADLLDAPGDAVTVQRPHRRERLQYHQVERAVGDFGSRTPPWVLLLKGNRRGCHGSC